MELHWIDLHFLLELHTNLRSCRRILTCRLLGRSSPILLLACHVLVQRSRKLLSLLVTWPSQDLAGRLCSLARSSVSAVEISPQFAAQPILLSLWPSRSKLICLIYLMTFRNVWMTFRICWMTVWRNFLKILYCLPCRRVTLSVAQLSPQVCRQSCFSPLAPPLVFLGPSLRWPSFW